MKKLFPFLAITVVALVILLTSSFLQSQETIQPHAARYASASCTPWTEIKSPYVSKGVLSAVVSGPTTQWAVGYHGWPEQQILIEENNGSASGWKVISTNFKGKDSSLYGLTRISDSNLWAVGYYVPKKTSHPNLLMLHYDGTSWKKIHVPNPVDPLAGLSQLQGICASGRSDIYAVGYYLENFNSPEEGIILPGIKGFILHYDGTNWSLIEPLAPPSLTCLPYLSFYFTSVAQISSTNLKIAGYAYNLDNGVQFYSIVLSYDGTTWSYDTVPQGSFGQNQLAGITAIPGIKNYMAAGIQGILGFPQSQTLALQFGSTTGWQVMQTPNPSTFINEFTGIDAMSSNKVAAVGDYTTGMGAPLNNFAEGYDGTNWEIQKTPSYQPNNSLIAITHYGNTYFAVGYKHAHNHFTPLILTSQCQ